METANLVTYSDLWQVLGIFAGVWFAYFSLVISLAIAWYVRDANRRDAETNRRFLEMRSDTDRRFREMESNTDRRFQEMRSDTDRRFQEMEEASERRHQELLQAISLLYRHVHADGSPAIVPLADADPTLAEPMPAPADN